MLTYSGTYSWAFCGDLSTKRSKGVATLCTHDSPTAPAVNSSDKIKSKEKRELRANRAHTEYGTIFSSERAQKGTTNNGVIVIVSGIDVVAVGVIEVKAEVEVASLQPSTVGNGTVVPSHHSGPVVFDPGQLGLPSLRQLHLLPVHRGPAQTPRTHRPLHPLVHGVLGGRRGRGLGEPARHVRPAQKGRVGERGRRHHGRGERVGEGDGRDAPPQGRERRRAGHQRTGRASKRDHGAVGFGLGGGGRQRREKGREGR